MTFMNNDERDALRKDIERLTREYLRRGNRIVEVPHGVSGIGGNGVTIFRTTSINFPVEHSTKRKKKEKQA